MAAHNPTEIPATEWHIEETPILTIVFDVDGYPLVRQTATIQALYSMEAAPPRRNVIATLDRDRARRQRRS